jgi:hypothetical protein
MRLLCRRLIVIVSISSDFLRFIVKVSSRLQDIRRMVVLLRVFTRVRHRKGKGLVAANSESKTPQPNMQRTMRVI